MGERGEGAIAIMFVLLSVSFTAFIIGMSVGIRW